MPNFSRYEKIVPRHIEHEYYDVARQKSLCIPIGLLDLNENKRGDMEEIMKTIRDYVPYVGNEAEVQVQFFGDLLTAEQARSSQHSRTDSDSSVDRREGLLCCPSDFHCSMHFVDLIYTHHFRSTSALTDTGTLANLKLHLKRKGVNRKAKQNYQTAVNFLQDVTDGYILAWATKYYAVNSPADIDITTAENDLSDRFWSDVESILRNIMFDDFEQNVSSLMPESFSSLPSGVDHSYAAVAPSVEEPDTAFLYVKNLVTLSLMERNFQDAVKEMDGNRVFRIWKIKMLYFKAHQRQKYALASLRYTADQNALPLRIGNDGIASSILKEEKEKIFPWI